MEESIDKTKKRKPKKLPVYVSENDFLKIIRVTKFKHHKLAFMLGFYSGLRISEILELEPRDFDFKRGTILVREGKGSKDGVTKIPKFFIKPMLDLLPLKNHCRQRALQKAFIKACTESGVIERKPTIHFHSLRHGFCTTAIEKGIDITRVQVLARHSNIATTNIYTHLNPKIALEEFNRKW